MTKAELFALFAKYDGLRAQAISKRYIYDRVDALDEALDALLNELANAAKED